MKYSSWSNKIKACAICKVPFIVRKNAKTTDTTTLCFKCRRNVKQTVRDLKND